MKVLTLQHDTFLRTFSSLLVNGDVPLQLGESAVPIQFVQPADGILKDYEQVKVISTEKIGLGNWTRMPVTMTTTYAVKKYDDLSVILHPISMEVPFTEQEIKKPLVL